MPPWRHQKRTRNRPRNKEIIKVKTINKKPKFSLFQYNEYSILLQWNSGISDPVNQIIHNYSKFLLTQQLVESTIPAYDSLLVFFKQRIDRLPDIKLDLFRWYEKLPPGKIVQNTYLKIPVCYHSDFGPDLHYLCQLHQLTTEEIIKIHTSPTYSVHMIGFLPGFPYLAGLSCDIHTPRRKSPRPRVTAGSVGIGNTQTGIYPITSPGGWQLIGRTPIKLFDPNRDNPFWIKGREKIRFYAIERQEYDALSKRNLLIPDDYRYDE